MYNEKVLVFKKKYGLDGKFVIMYSGNIGLYYDLENLIKVVEKIKVGTKTTDGREIVFAFVGAGSVLDKLVLYVKEHHMDNVTFIPYQDTADLIYSLNAGDVHWCVNAKGIKGVSCPSKAYGIMAASKPILGVLESGSEVRCLIEDTHGGLCCEPGEYDKVEENIRWFIENAVDAALNLYDLLHKNAVQVYDQREKLIGYVPRYYAEAFAAFIKEKRVKKGKILCVDKNRNCDECIKIEVSVAGV